MKRARPSAPTLPIGGSLAPGASAFLSRMGKEVVRPFTRDTGLRVVTFLMDWPSPRREAGRPLAPVHPECADRAGDLACQECWAQHQPYLREHPQVYAQRCPYGKACATIPVVFKRRCIAASKLVCEAAMPDDAFERAVEHLDALTEAFVRRERAWFAELMGTPAPAGPGATPAPHAVEPVARPPAHGHVGRALCHIRENLNDPQLRVASVAEAVYVDVAHLAHLFSVQTGCRMSWVIMAERMDRAAELLLGPTRSRIQDIAPQVGYTNRAWFSHAFRLHTGLTPTQFRAAGRSKRSC